MQEERRRQRRNKRPRWLLVFALLALLGGGAALFYQSRSERLIEKNYAHGEELVEQGDYARAVAVFEAIYRQHPHFHLAPRALLQAGKTLNFNLTRYRRALLDFLLIERDYPRSPAALQAQEQVAEIYKYRLNDYGNALVAYQKLLDSGAPHPDRIQYEIADTYFRRNNFEQARIEFESLLKNDPASSLVPEAAYRIGVAYSLDGNAAAAEKAFRRVLKNWPKNYFASEARFALAGVLESQGRLKAALRALKKLRGKYRDPEILKQRITRIEKRMRKKRLTY